MYTVCYDLNKTLTYIMLSADIYYIYDKTCTTQNLTQYILGAIGQEIQVLKLTWHEMRANI